jgi:hypothetical protein
MLRRDFLIMTAATLLAGCAGQGGTTSSDTSGMRFSDKERGIIEAFYGKPTGPLPAQRASAGDVLDSGQRPMPLPSDLNARLPYLPSPYTRYIVGSDVVLVNRDTHAILDVVPQIVR